MTTEPSTAISLKDLDFSWTKSRENPKSVGHKNGPLFQNLNLDIGAGEKVFLHGPSGSGKSTLLGLICGTSFPDKGLVEVHGENLNGLSARHRDRFRAERIGVIFQLFNLVPYLTALENVLLPISFAPDRRRKAGGSDTACRQTARELLSRLGLDADEFAEQSSSQLSVGQQQRVAAARALIGQPDLIIADEPTSSLDSDRRAEFMKLLFEELDRSGAALLFVSHDLALKDGFDRTLALGDLNGTSNSGNKS